MKKNTPKAGSQNRVGKNHFVTKSGNTVRLNRNLTDRMKSRKEMRQQAKAAYLATLPKGRVMRILARLHPKRVARYWFSRQGAIMALKLLGIGTVASFLLLVGIFAYFRKDLPNLKEDISGQNLGGSMRYYDHTGQTLLWEDFEAIKRVPVKSDQIAQTMKDATVAIEDKDFYRHGGFDVRGITRAGINNFTGSGGRQGGSTITQQLVKLTQNWTEDRSYTRKIKELILAVEMERSYTKDEILTGYLNAAPYGDVENGVEAAAKDYFKKSAKDLTLAESTFLAAIPQSPSLYSPYGSMYDANALIRRQHYILDQMYAQGKVKDADRKEAKAFNILATVNMDRGGKYDNIKAPYFVMAAKASLLDKYGSKTVNRGGWSVITTIDLNLQGIAEDQVAKGMRQVRLQHGNIAAFAAEDVTNGQMVALVGGPDFNNTEYGKVNFATEPLPPGSSFKPYDYVSLIDNSSNFGAGSVLYDSLGPLEGWPCIDKSPPSDRGDNTKKCLWDYDKPKQPPGPITLRYALGGSRNIPAAKAMLINGVDRTINTAEKMGLKSGYKCYRDGVNISAATSSDEIQCGASSSIGDGAYLHLDEHVHGYATLSRNGLNLDQTYILKITDSNNKNVFEWKPSKGKQVVKPDSAYIVADMISDPNASYLAQKIQRYKNWKFSVKTGTTNDVKDGWMMGFSTKYAAGVYVGHSDHKEMTGFMENMTLPIWNGFMTRAHENLQPTERPKPAGVQTLPAFVVRQHVGAYSREPSPATDLFPSWYKQPTKKTGQNQVIDQVSNKLATSCTPERAKKTTNNADVNTFSGDTFVSSGRQGNADVTQPDDIHNCSDAKPSITITATGCSVLATVSAGSHPLSSVAFPGKINFIINGQIVQSAGVNDSPSSVNYTAPAGTSSITAQVIDSVLYDTSDTVNLDCGGGQSLTLGASGSGGGAVNFSWSGGEGSTGVYRSPDNALLCTSASNSCARDVPSGTVAYARDERGNISNTVTVP